MKINYKNTALGLLDHIDPFSFRVMANKEHSQQEVSQFGLSVVENWHMIVDRFKEKIRYISNPFYEAYSNAVHKMVGLIDAQEIDDCGTFIMKVSEKETNTIFYDIRTEGKGSDFKIIGVVFIFNNDTSKDKPSLGIYVQRNGKGIKQWISQKAEENGCTNITVLADILMMVIFLKYCDTETKIIPPNKKDHHIGIKYVNDTKQKIEVLDSTWFTTLVKSDAFKVRGHFRFQPCGHNLSDRKLIWISDFEKSGYTREAKILSQNQ